MDNLRTIPEDFSSNIRLDRGKTLIRIAANGDLRQETTALGKDGLIHELKPEDRLLMAWTGQYRTDIFLVTPADLQKHYHYK